MIKGLPDSLAYLEDLYTYLKEKPRHMEKMMTDFYAGSRNKKLAEKIGFAPKRVFIPEKAYKDELIGMIRSAVQEEEMDPCDVALIWLLQQANCLKQYFSKHETDQLKDRLKEMKKDPVNKQIANMIDYVSDMAAVIAAAVIVAVN